MAVDVVERITAQYGGAAALARRLNISRSAISQWRKKQIPVNRVLDIERLTGIPRHELRPDIYPVPRDGEAAE